MQLILEELGDARDELKQEMTASSNQFIRAVRPHILKFDSPAGSLIVEIRNNDDQVLAASNTVAIASLPTDNGVFFHGYIQFDINAEVKQDESLFIVLKSSGYTFAESDFIGWCKDFDLRKYSPDFTPNLGFSSAFDMEVWSSVDKQRGITV